MSKIVITGCTGSIGISLIEKHLSINDTVYAIVRPGSQRIENLPKNPYLKIIKCDINNLLSLTKYIDSAEYFYHLAYSGVKKELRNDPYLQINNIKYTIDAIKVAKELGCKKFIGTGSQAEYGINENIINEEDKVDPIIGYGIAKYASGKLGKIYADKIDIQFNWVRIFSVYGIYDDENTIINTCISKMLKNESIDFTNATQNWEFLFSSDCANALYLVMTKGISGKIYNISSGESKELKKYILKIKEILNSNSKLNFGVIKQENIVTLKSDISNIKKDTLFKPIISFEDGIKIVTKNYLNKE